MIERLNAALSGRYSVERELGEGGMATVYLAQDERHDRSVALKVLKPELAAVVGAERFLAEIRTTANLQHPHILPLFDSGEADGFLYYVMPYVEGESLRERLDREKQLPVDEAVSITVKVAGALQAAHQQGVVHRDIKPANILLSKGEPLVADFGIALAVQEAGEGRLTETGLSVGTPYYMSPEQATGDCDPDARSDVYSLACVLYEMLAGDPPHTGSTAQAVLARILTTEPVPVAESRSTVPAHVDAVLGKALQKLPADRFTSAAVFAEALENRDARWPVAGARRDGSGTSRTRDPGGVLLDRRMLGTVLVVMTVLAAWGWLGRRGPAVESHPWRVAAGIPDSIRITASDGLDLSRDGSLLVFTGRTTEFGGVWVRRAGSPRVTAVAGTEGGLYPAISPDGRRVAFTRYPGLYVIPVEGGEPRRLGRSPLAGPLAWLDDGHVIQMQTDGLFKVPVDGGEPTRLTTVDTVSNELWHGMSDVVGDGEGIVFSVVRQGLEESEISLAVVDVAGGNHEIVGSGMRALFGPPGHLLVWSSDGEIVALPFDPDARRAVGDEAVLVSGLNAGVFAPFQMAASHSGRLAFMAGRGEPRHEVVRVDRDGSAAEIDSSWTGDFSAVAVSPDGVRVAVVDFATASSEELELLDVETGAVSHIRAPVGQPRTPVFANDTTLLFGAPGVPRSALYLVDANTPSTPEALLVSEDRFILEPSIVPGGRTVYYSSVAGGESDIRTLEIGTVEGEGQTDWLATAASESKAVPSPRGSWIAYVSDATGRPEVYVRDADPSGSQLWQLSERGTDELAAPRWAPDGTRLYFVDGGRMTAATVRLAPTFQVENVQTLFPTAPYASWFDVHPEGGFVMVRFGPSVGRIEMLEDWRAEVTR